jgi:hypothetical protein
MYKSSSHNTFTNASAPSFRMAKIKTMFDSINVVVGSEEKIFEEVFVTGVLPNNRVVKFKKSSLEFV